MFRGLTSFQAFVDDVAAADVTAAFDRLLSMGAKDAHAA
jgi:hypothetical protein